jgi:hypothetical protein
MHGQGPTNAKVDSYMQKQGSPQREICQKLREILLNTLPNVREEMKWGVPTYADGKVYIVALKDHVNLGFSLDALPAAEQKQLEGSGKTMKHIEVRSLDEINEKRIVELLELVLKKA